MVTLCSLSTSPEKKKEKKSERSEGEIEQRLRAKKRNFSATRMMRYACVYSEHDFEFFGSFNVAGESRLLNIFGSQPLAIYFFRAKSRTRLTKSLRNLSELWKRKKTCSLSCSLSFFVVFETTTHRFVCWFFFLLRLGDIRAMDTGRVRNMSGACNPSNLADCVAPT